MAKFNPDKALAKLNDVEHELIYRLMFPVHARMVVLQRMRERLIAQFTEHGYELVSGELGGMVK